MSEQGPISPEPDDEEDSRVPLVRLDQAVAAAAMALIGLISFANVVVRYVTSTSFAFTEEYSVFLLVIMTFMGAAVPFARNGHLALSFFRDRMPRSGRAICDVIAIAASVLMFALVAYHGAGLAWDNYIYGETSPGLGYPVWIYTVWLPILSLWIIFRIAWYAWVRFGKHA